MTKLERLRAKFKQQSTETRTDVDNGTSVIYPFWNMNNGESATIRFLPSVNAEDDFFTQEFVFYLKFPAGAGEELDKVIIVPSMKSFNKPCRILDDVRGFYKDDVGTKEWRSNYWHKPITYASCLVIESPFDEPDAPLVRVVKLRKTLFNKLRDGFEDVDMDDLPCEFKGGTNFYLRKNQNGQWPDWNSSGFARKPSDLLDDKIEELKSNLIDPKDFRFKEPTEAEQEEHYALFQHSAEGLPFENSDKWPTYNK